MKLLRSILVLAAATVLCNGCVSRTVSIEQQNRGHIEPTKKGQKASNQGEVIEKKIVWIWQKEYRNSK